MRLRSSFRDYYDIYFDGIGDSFVRIGGNREPNKRTQFQLLKDNGFTIPPIGTVGEVLDTWWESENRWIRNVVAYEDELAHCGEGKKILNHGHFQHLGSLMTGGVEAYRLGNLFCSAYVGHPHQRPTISWRRLQIGHRVFWIEYSSGESWMSNCGDNVECTVIGTEVSEYYPKLNAPIFAIDFVIGVELYAVDLNFAPGVRGSGVEKIFASEDAVWEIETWHKEFGNEPTNCEVYSNVVATDQTPHPKVLC